MTRIMKTKTKMQYLITLQDVASGKRQVHRVLAKSEAAATSRAVKEAKKKAPGDYVLRAVDYAN